MRALFPCDLGDDIEVIHDVEEIEIEMDCDLDEDSAYSAPYERIEIHFEPASVFTALDDLSSRERVAAFEMLGTRSPVVDTLPFSTFDPIEVRDETVPYPRFDPETVPFVRAPP